MPNFLMVSFVLKSFWFCPKVRTALFSSYENSAWWSKAISYVPMSHKNPLEGSPSSFLLNPFLFTGLRLEGMGLRWGIYHYVSSADSLFLTSKFRLFFNPNPSFSDVIHMYRHVRGRSGVQAWMCWHTHEGCVPLLLLSFLSEIAPFPALLSSPSPTTAPTNTHILWLILDYPSRIHRLMEFSKIIYYRLCNRITSYVYLYCYYLFIYLAFPIDNHIL